jgi:hypothetical protein
VRPHWMDHYVYGPQHVTQTRLSRNINVTLYLITNPKKNYIKFLDTAPPHLASVNRSKPTACCPDTEYEQKPPSKLEFTCNTTKVNFNLLSYPDALTTPDKRCGAAGLPGLDNPKPNEVHKIQTTSEESWVRNPARNLNKPHPQNSHHPCQPITRRQPSRSR